MARHPMTLEQKAEKVRDGAKTIFAHGNVWFVPELDFDAQIVTLTVARTPEEVMRTLVEFYRGPGDGMLPQEWLALDPEQVTEHEFIPGAARAFRSYANDPEVVRANYLDIPALLSYRDLVRTKLGTGWDLQWLVKQLTEDYVMKVLMKMHLHDRKRVAAGIARVRSFHSTGKGKGYRYERLPDGSCKLWVGIDGQSAQQALKELQRARKDAETARTRGRAVDAVTGASSTRIRTVVDEVRRVVRERNGKRVPIGVLLIDGTTVVERYSFDFPDPE